MVLLNASTMRVRPTLYFFDQDGTGIAAESVVEISSSLEVRRDGGLRVRSALPPLGELTISTNGRGDVVVGSVRVISDGPIGGVLRFSLPGAGVAGVGASEPVADALFPARRQTGGINTGVALRNLGAGAITVSCYLMRGGSVLEDAEIPLEADGQTARFINEIFPGAGTSDFVGSVRCTAPDGGRFAGIALEMDFDNGIFTTLPVVPVKGGGRPGVSRMTPTVSLSASPTSIQQGQHSTLRWSSTNATSATITPGIGTVSTSGSRRVSPTQTTTYRITARGSDGQTASASATVTVEPVGTAGFRDDFDSTASLSNWELSNAIAEIDNGVLELTNSSTSNSARASRTLGSALTSWTLRARVGRADTNYTSPGIIFRTGHSRYSTYRFEIGSVLGENSNFRFYVYDRERQSWNPKLGEGLSNTINDREDEFTEITITVKEDGTFRISAGGTQILGGKLPSGFPVKIQQIELWRLFNEFTTGTVLFDWIEIDGTVAGSDPPDDGENQTCKKGSVIEPGGKCDVVDTSGAKIGTFEVSSSGRGVCVSAARFARATVSTIEM